MRFTMWAVTSAVLLAGPVRADDAPQYQVGEQFFVDQVMPFPEDGKVNLSIAAGPVDFTGIRIKDMPSAEEMAKARDSEKSRVEPIVIVEGVEELGKGLETRVVIDLALEDATGRPVISCVKAVNIDPGDLDSVSVCTLGARTFYTRSWPPQRIHLKATLTVKR